MASRAAGGTLADWAYAAGDPSLVSEVESYARRPSRFGRTRLEVDFLPGKDLRWPTFERKIQTSGFARAHRLLVIRDAEKADPEVWDKLLSWWRSTDAYERRLVLVLATSNERWNNRDKLDPRYLAFVKNPHTSDGRKVGQFIDCHLPVDKHARFVELKIGSSRTTVNLTQISELVAARCGGDVTRLKSECDKLLAYVGETATVRLEDVEAVVRPSPGELFVDALIKNQKPLATQRAPYVGALRAALGLLDYNVQALYLIHLVKNQQRSSRRMTTNAIAERTGLPYFVVQRLERTAVSYDLTTTRRRMLALAKASLRLRTIDKPEWVLQPLVVEW